MRGIEDMTPLEAYEEGYRNGESSLVADIDTLCDQLDIEYEGHPITAVREEVLRLRAANRGMHKTEMLGIATIGSAASTLCIWAVDGSPPWGAIWVLSVIALAFVANWAARS